MSTSSSGNSYDLAIIGAGAAGMNVAVPATKLGLRTLLIEKSPDRIGGECLNDGCVPSKALLHIAALRRAAHGLERFGYTTNGPLRFAAVGEYIRGVQRTIRAHESPDVLRDLGIHLQFGTARFTSRNEVDVTGQRFRARRFVLATGSKALRPAIPGLDEVRHCTHESIFDLEELPRRLLVLGAGAVGVELGQAFAMLGAEVTLVDRGVRILRRHPPEATSIFEQILCREGIRFLPNAHVLEFRKPNTATVRSGADVFDLSFDLLLIAIGKEPHLAEMELDRAGVQFADGRLELDGYLRTTNKQIFVCGDAAGHHYLTHASELQSAVILFNLFSPVKKRVRYDHLSWVTFTHPEIASFGLTESELKRRGASFRKVAFDIHEDRAVTDDYPQSKLIVYLDGGTILGGTMIAPNAGELIQELILARQHGISVYQLLEKTYPYPTAARVNRWLSIQEWDRRIGRWRPERIMPYLFRAVNFQPGKSK